MTATAADADHLLRAVEDKAGSGAAGVLRAVRRSAGDEAMLSFANEWAESGEMPSTAHLIRQPPPPRGPTLVIHDIPG